MFLNKLYYLLKKRIVVPHSPYTLALLKVDDLHTKYDFYVIMIQKINKIDK